MFPKYLLLFFRINILATYFTLFILLVIVFLFILIILIVCHNLRLTFTVPQFLLQLLSKEHLVPLKLFFLSKLVVICYLLLIRIFIVSHLKKFALKLLFLGSVEMIGIAVLRWFLSF